MRSGQSHWERKPWGPTVGLSCCSRGTEVKYCVRKYCSPHGYFGHASIVQGICECSSRTFFVLFHVEGGVWLSTAAFTSTVGQQRREARNRVRQLFLHLWNREWKVAVGGKRGSLIAGRDSIKSVDTAAPAHYRSPAATVEELWRHYSGHFRMRS